MKLGDYIIRGGCGVEPIPNPATSRLYGLRPHHTDEWHGCRCGHRHGKIATHTDTKNKNTGI